MYLPSLVSLPSFFVFTLALQFSLVAFAQSPPNRDSQPKPESQTVQLWKSTPPGETVELPPEADTTKPDQPPTGGHGYGLRHVDGVPVTDWPRPFGQWLKVSGWMEK